MLTHSATLPYDAFGNVTEQEHDMGRNPMGARALTNAEKQARYRERIKQRWAELEARVIPMPPPPPNLMGTILPPQNLMGTILPPQNLMEMLPNDPTDNIFCLEIEEFKERLEQWIQKNRSFLGTHEKAFLTTTVESLLELARSLEFE
jgi:hypothetical protein